MPSDGFGCAASPAALAGLDGYFAAGVRPARKRDQPFGRPPVAVLVKPAVRASNPKAHVASRCSPFQAANRMGEAANGIAPPDLPVTAPRDPLVHRRERRSPSGIASIGGLLGVAGPEGHGAAPLSMSTCDPLSPSRCPKTADLLAMSPLPPPTRIPRHANVSVPATRSAMRPFQPSSRRPPHGKARAGCAGGSHPLPPNPLTSDLAVIDSLARQRLHPIRLPVSRSPRPPPAQ